MARKIGPQLKKTECCVMAAAIFSAVLGSLSGCTSDKDTTTAGTQSTGLVSVSGKVISRDGKPWIPHAFQQVAFVAPPGYISSGGAMPIFVTAAQSYTTAEYQQMVLQGADAVRIQFAQTGVDPQGLYASQTFTNNVIAAVKAARADGLTVILSDQDEAQTERNKSARASGWSRAGRMDEFTNDGSLDRERHRDCARDL